MHFVRRLLPLAALMALAQTAPLSAQDKEPRWKDSFYPFLGSASNDFPLLGLRFSYRKGADYFARVTSAANFSIDVGTSFHGSRLALASFKAPLLWPRWRVAAQLGTTRESRFGFFGLGNNTVQDPALEKKPQQYFYRVQRTRYMGQVEATRELASHFSVALAGRYEHVRFSDLPGPSVFNATFGSDLRQSDGTGRLTLIYDTRDNEYNTHQGLFVEASGAVGSGGNGYSRVTVIGRGYLPLWEGRTVLALRVAGSGTGGTPPLNTRFEIPAWERGIPVLGGAPSNRGLDYQRLVGEHVLLANAEVRQDLLNLGDYGAITLLAFFDAGRVFENESFKLTTRDMKVGAGGGIVLRILRSGIIPFNFGGGSEGFTFSTGAGWMF
ncbi:MAG: BamA/TamA family outer membrane protein [Gemmatimonadales bacterium]